MVEISDTRHARSISTAWIGVRDEYRSIARRLLFYCVGSEDRVGAGGEV